ncbi:hypothetical protein LH991_16375 [Schleiferilactobacillus harbinensis]|uniref:hypothetical protein n=1 Tax=Schleiferilactobacillus harbinensis TaxID=304207 RepID=UPI00048007F6|nr:hypothetical protein [Schleiferilactobacillus harbinensis]QFR65350.1 hypothetical protein LH991_16105 [Schleiferilactobacillus harbinensis]QFR65397.1 hypothetical protein LH991_16375 [Schleiferilactobacillus harbinensis]
MTELKSLAQIMIPDGQRLAKLYDNQGNLIWRAEPEVLWTGSEQLNRKTDIKLSETFGELPNGIVLYGTPRIMGTDPQLLTPDGGVQISQEMLLGNEGVAIYFDSMNAKTISWSAGSLSSNVWPSVISSTVLGNGSGSAYTLLKIVEG